MADTQIGTAKLLQKIGIQAVEIDLLREQKAALERELQGLRDAEAAKPKPKRAHNGRGSDVIEGTV